GAQGATGVQGEQGVTGVLDYAPVAAHYHDTSVTGIDLATGVAGATGPMIYSAQDFDTDSAYDNLTGTFTAPTDGHYQVNAYTSFQSSGPSWGIYLLKNGT